MTPLRTEVPQRDLVVRWDGYKQLQPDHRGWFCCDAELLSALAQMAYEKCGYLVEAALEQALAQPVCINGRKYKLCVENIQFYLGRWSERCGGNTPAKQRPSDVGPVFEDDRPSSEFYPEAETPV